MEKVLGEEEGSAQPARGTRRVARETLFLFGWPLENMMESAARQCPLCLIQIICLRWFKPHLYTRENDWPQLIWEMEVCSGKENSSWSEGRALDDSGAADVFSISVSERETSSSCANGRDICYQCQYFVNCFTLPLVSYLFSLPLGLRFNKYFRWRDSLWKT